MRKMLVILGTIVALLLTVGAAACGGGAQSSSLSPADETPQGILTAAMVAAEDMTSATGDFEVAISFDVDPSQLPDEAQAFVQEPMTVAGTFAYGADPQAADLTLALSLMGESMNVGMRMAGTQAWLQFSDQWYEAPPEMGQMLGASSAEDAQAAGPQQMLADLGIDPLTWIKDLTLVGEETIDDTVAYHLAGSPDLAKIMTDALGILQNEESMKLLDPTGSASEMMGAGSLVPGAEELAQMEQQLAAMFQEFTADVWIAKESLMPLRFEAAAKMVPPAGEDAQGMNAITLDMALSLRDVNEPVAVEAPAAARPWSELEKAMEEDPGMIFGPLSGLLGMTGAGSVSY